MKADIIISGVGGQGILSIAAVIGMAAMHENLNVKQAEVHGMSQRGGAVQSHLRLSSEEVASDLIPEGEADMILSVEPMEALRYLPFLAEKGWVISNSTPFVNIPDYPDKERLLKEYENLESHILLDADEMAREVGNMKASNMVVLGASAAKLPLKKESFHAGISSIFSRKGEEIINLNLRAFEAGFKFASAELT
jgi:indolepyruvate ferredoxin oxidoreductase beta subunit